MRGRSTHTTTAQLIAQAVIHLLNGYPNKQRLAEVWDEAVHHGNASLAWVYEIKQAEIIGNGQSLFNAVNSAIKREEKIRKQYA